MKSNYYVYFYLREDGSPYYVGRGKDNRAFVGHHNVTIPPKERITFFKENITFDESVNIEKELISLYGRKDNNTGILRNLTDGGEGALGYNHTEENKLSISKKMSRVALERSKKGTHNFLGGEVQKRSGKARVASGTHHLLTLQKNKVTSGDYEVLCVNLNGDIVKIKMDTYRQGKDCNLLGDLVHINSFEGRKRREGLRK